MFEKDHRVKRQFNRELFPRPGGAELTLGFPARSKCCTWQKGNLLPGQLTDPLIQGLLKGEREREKKRKRGMLVRAEVSVKNLIGT